MDTKLTEDRFDKFTETCEHRSNCENMGVMVPDNCRDYCAIYYDNKANQIAKEHTVMREALESIAKNTCCDKCQEAALVAQKAIKEVSGE